MNRNSTSKHAFYAALVSAALTLVIGIVLTAKPGILLTVCNAAGGLLCLAGLVLIVQYYIPKFRDRRLFNYGLIAAPLGVLLILLPGLLSFLVPVLFGLWVAGNSLLGILRNVTMRSEHRLWWVGVLLNAVSAALGIFILTRPMAAMETTVRIIGIALIVFAMLRLVSVLMARQYFADEPSGEVIDTTLNQD